MKIEKKSNLNLLGSRLVDAFVLCFRFSLWSLMFAVLKNFLTNVRTNIIYYRNLHHVIGFSYTDKYTEYESYISKNQINYFICGGYTTSL